MKPSDQAKAAVRAIKNIDNWGHDAALGYAANRGAVCHFWHAVYFEMRRRFRLVLRRAQALITIRRLEIRLHGLQEAANQACTIAGIDQTRRDMESTTRALEQARQAYAALPQPGRRPTWRPA